MTNTNVISELYKSWLLLITILQVIMLLVKYIIDAKNNAIYVRLKLIWFAIILLYIILPNIALNYMFYFPDLYFP